MKNITLTLLACAVFAAATAPIVAAAPAVQMDGKLPMYPGAKLDPKEAGIPANAIVQGVPLVITSADAMKRVDAWYGSNAPKACVRTAQSGGVKYKCPGGSIMIYVKGPTNIALIPAFPGM